MMAHTLLYIRPGGIVTLTHGKMAYKGILHNRGNEFSGSFCRPVAPRGGSGDRPLCYYTLSRSRCSRPSQKRRYRQMKHEILIQELQDVATQLA